MKLTKYALMLCFVVWASLPGLQAQGSDPNEIEKLKTKLAEQQKQMDSLVKALKDQQATLDGMSKPAPPAAPAAAPQGGALMASSTPMLAPPAARSGPQAESSGSAAGSSSRPARLQLKLGNISITPVGFLDATAVWRSKAAGSGDRQQFRQHPF